jgi:hypothetical protein
MLVTSPEVIIEKDCNIFYSCNFIIYIYISIDSNNRSLPSNNDNVFFFLVNNDLKLLVFVLFWASIPEVFIVFCFFFFFFLFFLVFNFSLSLHESIFHHGVNSLSIYILLFFYHFQNHGKFSSAVHNFLFSVWSLCIFLLCLECHTCPNDKFTLARVPCPPSPFPLLAKKKRKSKFIL